MKFKDQKNTLVFYHQKYNELVFGSDLEKK